MLLEWHGLYFMLIVKSSQSRIASLIFYMSLSSLIIRLGLELLNT